MKQEFPLVGVIGPNYLYRSLVGPALALGVDLRNLGSQMESIRARISGCDFVTVLGNAIPISTVRTLENDGHFFRPNSNVLATLRTRFPDLGSTKEIDQQVEVLVARSPHSQACAWAPTELIFRDGLHRISVVSGEQLVDSTAAQLQRQSLDLMQEMEIVGVASFLFHKIGADFELRYVSAGPSLAGNWTTNAAITDQFEQHLRAILDLPLGDPSMSARYTATGNFLGPENEKRNMYRPYLHLMARSPEMKFHQYRDPDATFAGYITVAGNDPADLLESMWHALDYLDGEIDE